MENLTDILVSQMLSSLDPSPVYPSREQKFFAFLICKNLSELCETGEAILHDIETRGFSLENLPEYDNLSLSRQILKVYYRDSMFKENSDGDSVPDWNIIESFDTEKSNTAYRVYKAIRKNVIDKPHSQTLRKAIHERDRKYFLENYEKLFEKIPFKDAMIKYKNFLIVDYVKQEHMEYLWNFFESLLDIFIYEKDNIEDLKSM